MSDARPGWYADPSGQADLRWWDGRTWSAETRAHPTPVAAAPSATPTAPLPVVAPPTVPTPPTAPGSPFLAPGATGPDADATALTAPIPIVPTSPSAGAPASTKPPPPAAPVPSSPGSFANWSGTAGPVPPVSPGAAWGAPAAPAPPAGGSPSDAESRSWLPWALTGAGVALIVVLVGFLAASILGSSSTPSSTGLSAQGSSTTSPTPTTRNTTNGAGAPSSSTTLPPTTTLPLPPGTPAGPPGSRLYTDPGGTYTVAVGPAWTRGNSRINGIPLWYIPAVGTGAGRATFDVTSEELPYSMGLEEFVTLTEQSLRTQSSLTLLSSTDIKLADGVPATRITYQTRQIDGVTFQGEAILAISSTNAVVETVIAKPATAAAVFAQVDPYLRTLHLED